MKQTWWTVFLLLPLSVPAAAADVYGTWRAQWLAKAQIEPQLHYQDLQPVTAVKAVNDKAAFQGWRYEKTEGWDSLYNADFKKVKSITLDFGRHMVGYLRFHTRDIVRCQDAPVRLKFTLAELPAELNTPLDPWKGTLSRAWMQDETVTVTQTGTTITLPRRLAGRYLRIDLLGGSPDFSFAVDSVVFRAQSSAGDVKTALRPSCPALIQDINRIGIETLRECMQTVYEDGPKRDHRLWAGDLYLQSLVNRYSFRNFELTKRCLYILAAMSQDDGTVISNVFEQPQLHPQVGSVCLSYCLLFNAALYEYLQDTHDTATARDLWPVARQQMLLALRYVNKEGLFTNCSLWQFFDWREGLDVNTCMQGCTIFALEQTTALARAIGRGNEVKAWPALARKMRKAALRHLYDKKSSLFVSGPDRQVSDLSQAWMIISGVADRETGQRALRTSMASHTAVRPGTPYATHYLVDAMLQCGMTAEARQYLTQYWGGMVKKGADTFWEAYDPQDDYLSPYSFFPVNSACHAWSCTPVYFIHKYPEIFQQQ